SHQLVGGPMGTILGDFLISVQRHAPTLIRADVPALNEAFASLLGAALNGSADALAAASPAITASQFDRARRFISANLKSPGLKTARIAAGLGISRRQLSSLFEPHGGVANYIRNRRLAACHMALTRSAGREHSGATAYEHGFTNLASFYR